MNFYEGEMERYSYFITHVDDKTVGGFFSGYGAVNEIYLPEGRHKLGVILSIAGNHSFGNRSFNGPIECDLQSGFFYTIDYNQSEIPESYNTNKIGVRCIRHLSKPDNPYMRKIIKNGGKVSTDFYTEK